MSVGDKAVNAEARATFCDGEPAYRREQDTRTKRERGSGEGNSPLDINKVKISSLSECVLT